MGYLCMNQNVILRAIGRSESAGNFKRHPDVFYIKFNCAILFLR